MMNLPTDNPPGAIPKPPIGAANAILLATSLGLLSFVSTNFDLAIADLHQTECLPGDLVRIVRLSEFFAHGFGLATMIAAIWLLSPLHRAMLPRVALCSVGASMLANGVKLAIARLRPRAFLNNVHGLNLPQSIDSTWASDHSGSTIADLTNAYFAQSFPSSHAAAAAGIAIGLSWLFPQGRWLFAALAVLSSYQRIQSGAHWTSDVFAGAAIGALVAGSLIQNRGLGYVLGKFEARAAGKTADTPLTQTRALK